MTNDELRALADALQPMAAAPCFDGIDIERAAAHLRAQADAQPVPAVPAGWKLVPVEPTQAMNNAGLSAVNQYGKRSVWETYAAMLAAAPAAPQAEPKREPLSDERIDEIGEPFGYFQYGDAQGDKRRAFIDRLTRARDEARAERDAMANVLPGHYYMDPPDGGDVPVLEQLRRMAKDAARYRLLRRKFAIISDGEGHAEFCAINLPRPTYIAPNTAIELDTALDRERLGLDGTRPPTPVGWSDTDWIKRLQEQDEQPHPLAGQHINQGSMDAAADAYEAEYNAARGIT